MSRKKLILISIVALILAAAATAAILIVFSDQFSKSDETAGVESTQPTSETATLEEEAESILISDPEEAARKFRQAQELHQQAGDEAKASEMEVSAQSAEADARLKHEALTDMDDGVNFLN